MGRESCGEAVSSAEQVVFHQEQEKGSFFTVEDFLTK